MLSYRLKNRTVSGVTREEEPALRAQHREASPKGGVPVKESARGPALGGHKHNIHILACCSRKTVLLPPIELYTSGYSNAFHQTFDPHWNDPSGREREREESSITKTIRIEMRVPLYR